MNDPIIVNIDRNINDKHDDFIYLFRLYHNLKDISSNKILFHFNKCNFLQQNAVAFLGALTRLLMKNQNKVGFDMNSFNPDVKKNLQKNGFLRTLHLDTIEINEGNAIPYREDIHDAPNDYTHYLTVKWLGKEKGANFEEKIKDLVTMHVIEVYNNVFEHAKSSIGVMSCGQYYFQKYELKLVLVDFGVGIPYNVRSFLKKPDLTPKEALAWAFQSNNSTKTNHARGQGLKSLKTFVEQYKGKLEIYSDTGYVCIQGRGIPDVFQDNHIGFQGTLVQITIATNVDVYSNISDDNFDSDENFFSR